MANFVVELFPLKLPLKEIVLRAITVNLWSCADILLFSEVNTGTSRENELPEIVESAVKCKASKLPLPEKILKEIMNLVGPIGSELLRWKKFHETFLEMRCEDFDTLFFKRLCWTSAGTIDYRKTAREFVRCEIVDVVNRYKLACLYCLEEEITTIWWELPEDNKMCFYTEDPLQARQPDLEFYWACVQRGEGSSAPEWELAQLQKSAFHFSVIMGNQAAVKYFCNKLSCEVRETSLVETTKHVLADDYIFLGICRTKFPEENLSDVLCYLFSQMTPEQLMAVCNKFPFQILKHFLDWPRHDHFPDFARLLSSVSPEVMYESYIFLHSTGQLFQKFFPLSSDDFKKYFVDRECESGQILESLCAESLKVVFENVVAEDRARFVSCQSFIDIVLRRLIVDEEWDLIELCLREATLSKEDWMGVKKQYAKFFEVDKSHFKNRERRFFEILDKINAKTPLKRNSNDETFRAKHIPQKFKRSMYF